MNKVYCVVAGREKMNVIAICTTKEEANKIKAEVISEMARKNRFFQTATEEWEVNKNYL